MPRTRDLLSTADRVAIGEKITPEAKTAGHEACQRALAATSSIMQKQDIQEADFDIVGRCPGRRSWYRYPGPQHCR
jgi:hypothetical protein